MNPTPLIRLVDDDDDFRRSQRLFLSLLGCEIREWADPVAFLKENDYGRPGVIVLDIRMPAMSGLDLQKALYIRGSKIPIIFLTGHGTIDTAVYTMRYGAADFIEKSGDPMRLAESVKRAVDKSMKDYEKRLGREKLLKVWEALTPREREVLEAVAAGKTNKEIAESLSIGAETVKMHRSNAFAKIGASNALEAYQWLLKIRPEGEE